MSQPIGTVYLIHLESKIAHSQHYLGWSRYLKRRIEHHQNGTGAKFLAEAVRRQIGFKVVRRWKKSDGNFERKLKNQKNAPRLCPICSKEKKNALPEIKIHPEAYEPTEEMV